MSKKYFKNVLIAVDQLANTLLGGNADETLSSRLWRNQRYWYCRVAIKLLDCVFSWVSDTKTHCKDSYEAEIAGKHRGGSNEL